MLEPNIGRNEFGHPLPGAVLSPNGCKGNSVFSKAALQVIMDGFLSEYTLDELNALYGDKKRFGELSTAKAMILTRIVGATGEGDLGRKEFETVMDRTLGKASGSDTQINVQVNNHITKIERVIVEAKP